MQNKDFKINPQSTELNLTDQKIDDEGAVALADRLSDAKNLTKLGLGYKYNNIGDRGAEALADVLPRTNLTSLDLRGNNIGHEGAEALAYVLPRTSLSELDLYRNKLGPEGAAAIAGVLPSTSLKLLNLEVNDIGYEGAAALAGVLPRTSLSELYLFSNNIGPAGAAALAGVLPSTSLTRLYLGGNNIGPAGAAALAGVLPRTNLTTLYLAANNIGDATEAAILLSAENNPLFLTRIMGLRNSDQINAVVDANRQKLETTAKVGAFSLYEYHDFPQEIARLVAKYIDGLRLPQNISQIGNDEKVAELLSLAVSSDSVESFTEPSIVAPATSGSFATQASVAEVVSGDNDDKRSDDTSLGLGCVIV